ncbi:histidinol-phosphate phosphatase family domain-containing protein/HAD-superfamily hydrolase, subfamily IIIA [Psychrobacillus sp. OK028]|uniref:HAD-IIIA family hydrolase n=1 Tax=Psychrobacillus sp. OK028 TaxID=1884359 RepID=UPI00088DCE5A|nr:HAD-IIIA family hydrolase [Psychrobacillus sp. OK028]SDO17704.1 histidinol-phosphate phosphatase family domain-containing protein/HAD-superfamily hydrolase, subfamily IIIA [Psychrobacillus sp. OK028]
MNKEIEAVFLDRDGTIGGTGHFMHPDDFIPYSFSMEAIRLLQSQGIKVFGFTNQHRVSRGEAELVEFQKEFLSYGHDDAFICPHSLLDSCLCRKSNPGMLLDAANKYNLNLNKCAVIGDVGGTDMLAAKAVGAMKILVLTGWGEYSLSQYREEWKEVEPDYIADNLLEAVKWLLVQ